MLRRVAPFHRGGRGWCISTILFHRTAPLRPQAPEFGRIPGHAVAQTETSSRAAERPAPAGKPAIFPPLAQLWPWLVWLGLAYGTWLGLVIVGDHWQTLIDHTGIALAMVAGSYVAGSTPIGGGAVGFPILVLLFGQTAELGRDFSFAVQSVGMTSASLLVYCRRQRLEWPMLGPAMVGALAGTPLGVLFFAPHVPGVAVKLTFALMWASFGILHLYRTPELAAAEGPTKPRPTFDHRAGFVLGLLAGSTVAAVTGVGIEMALYSLLVLLRRADLKIAIPSAVLLMAFTSVVGIATKALFLGVEPGVYENWLAAVPIVLLGAPVGALVVAHIGRAPTLYVVSVLCLGQLVWTLEREWSVLGPGGLALALAALLLFNLLFEALFRLGRSASS